MDRKWVIKERPTEQVEALQQELKIHEVFCALLVDRGIYTHHTAKDFFRPSLEQLHDPFSMLGMDKAVNRLVDAISNNEKILIFGDYDVDGTTSVALCYTFFHKIYSNVIYYVPDRYKEGYGVSKEGIDFAAREGCTLILALDCGTKAIEQMEYASSKNIEFIICDHHEPGDTLPKAIMLNPKQESCEYPYEELSACGIAFKLVQAFAAQNAIEEEDVYPLLDFVVVSIASDIVPMTGENRTLAFFGLQQINEKPSPGLEALGRIAGIQSTIGIGDIVFKLGPRINAAGRMDSAFDAVRLLVSPDVNHAEEYAKNLHDSNSERMQVDKEITQQALIMIENDESYSDKKTTVLYDPSWHKGVVGIVASRVMEHHYRPTIILTSSNGMITGSARSVKGFDVYQAIAKCGYLLETFGGHKYAAGLTLKEENLEDFRVHFDKVVDLTIEKDQLVPKLVVDLNLDVSLINYKLYNILKQFGPFGPDNMKPTFRSNGFRDHGSRIVGKDHIKLALRNRDNVVVNGIAFNLADKFEMLQTDSVDICYNIDENEWQGVKSLQLQVKDIKRHES